MNPIKASNLFLDDGAIKVFVKQLEEATSLFQGLEKELESIKKKSLEYEKALEKVNASQKEGQDLIEENASAVDKLRASQEKTVKALVEEKAKINDLNKRKNSLIKQKQLEIQYNKAAEGSYNKLSALYSLTKIRLNAMSKAQRTATKDGVALEAEAKRLYMEMSRLQEATGKHTLSVGNYQKGLYGLNTSMNQITRELPTLGMNLNTFFLAISNNIPMFVDEIEKLNKANKEMIKQQKQTIPVGKAVLKSLFSWQTALSVGVALLTIYGKKIIEWIASLFKAKDATDAATMAINAMNKAITQSRMDSKEEVLTLELVYRATQKTTDGIEKRTEAVRRLKKEWPEYFKNFTEEEILAGKAGRTFAKLANSILKAAEAQAIMNVIIQNYERITEINLELDDLRAKKGEKITKKMMKLAEEGQKLLDINQKLAESINPEDLLDGTPEKVKEQLDNTLKYVKDSEKAKIDAWEDGILKRHALIVHNYRWEKQALEQKLKEDENITEEGRKAINDTIIYLEAEKNRKIKELYDQGLKDRIDSLQKEMDAIIDNSDVEAWKEFSQERIDQEYNTRMSEIDIMNITEKEKTRLRIQAERDRWQKILDDNEKYWGDLSRLEIMELQNLITKANQELNKEESFWEKLQLTDRDKQNLQEATRFVIDQFKQIADERKRLADEQVAASQKEVDNARDSLQQEIDLLNAGYAANVGAAQERLQLARETEAEALAEREKAAQAQKRLNDITTISSLITSAANIMKGWSEIPFIGQALGAAAVAAMFASFIVTKTKARSVGATISSPITARSEKGSYEVLEGESHAGGKGIYIGKKKNGHDHYAEGGEGQAIIRKSMVRKYGDLIPNVIDSINKGIFEEQFSNAFVGPDILPANVVVNAGKDMDFSTMEGHLSGIRKNTEEKYYRDKEGNTIMKYKNITRIIK